MAVVFVIAGERCGISGISVSPNAISGEKMMAFR
jgi:hypothetical protein